MESMRSTWTDSRLDDLANKVEAGFGRVDADIRGLRGEIGALQRTIIQVGGGLFVAVVGVIVTQL
jgi:hypothetical protein